MIDIDKNLEELKMEQDVDFDRIVDGIIRKKMRKTALGTVLAVLLVLGLIFAALSPILNAVNPNPYKLCDSEDGGSLRDVFDTYYESVMPYVDVTNASVEKKGFGKYKIDLTLMDMQVSRTWSSAKMEMTRGKLEITDNENMSLMQNLGRFQTKQDYLDSGMTEKDYENDVREDMEYMEKLPESAYVYVSVTDREKRKLTELTAMNRDDFYVVWAQIDQPDCADEDGEIMSAGLSLSKKSAQDDSDFREKLSEQELKDVYVNNLRLLVKHHDIWGYLGFSSGEHMVCSEDSAVERMEAMIQDAEKKDSLASYKYSIYGAKEEVLNYLKEQHIQHMTIDKIKPTLYE